MERDRKTEQLTEWDREILGVPEKDRKRGTGTSARTERVFQALSPGS